MDALFLKVLNMSFAATGLILGVILLRAVFRKAPRWALCGLWALVALRLLVPVTISSPASLVPREEMIPQETLLKEAPTAAPSLPETAPVPQTAPAAPADMPEPQRTWADYGAYVWLAGAGAMSLYALGSYLWLRRKVRPSLAVDVDVRICDDIDTPFVLGVLHPRIYLPSSLEGEQKAHVLAHEKAHLLRRDNWWKPLGFLTLVLHWFNPLCWLGYALFCRDMELAADEKVIRGMEKSDRVAYSKTLLACSAPRVATPCPLAFGEVGVRERIRSILRYKKPGILLVVLTAAAVLVLAVCFMTSSEEKLSANAIEGQDWVFTLVQDKDGHVIYRSRDSVYPEGEELDLSLKAENGVIHLESGEESWAIPFIPFSEKPEREIYALNGGDPTSGQSDLAVVSRTVYEDGSFSHTLILAVESWSIQFRAEGGKAGQEGSVPVNGENFFNAKVLRVYDDGFLVEPYPGRERQTATEFLISRDVLSTNPVPEADEGDHLRIVYNGGILETYPAQLDTVFAIYPLSEVEEKTEIGGSVPISGYPAAEIRSFAGDEGKLKDACLTLLDSGQFTMSFALHSSYLGAGTYTMEGNELTMDFLDGSIMAFTMDDRVFTVISDPDSYDEMGPHREEPAVVATYGSEGSKVYEELSDGTWRCGGVVYQYRLMLTDKMPNTNRESTFVVLSNRENISFREAMLASGISSSMDDYFDPAEAVVVSWE